MLPKLELTRGQASLAGWVVSKAAQCTSAAYTTEEVAAQQEQHKQLYRCKRTQRQQDQRDRELSQVQVKPGVVVHEGLLVLFLRLQAARLAVITIAMPSIQWHRSRQISGFHALTAAT
jgi:hypothetical protein